MNPFDMEVASMHKKLEMNRLIRDAERLEEQKSALAQNPAVNRRAGGWLGHVISSVHIRLMRRARAGQECA